MDFAQRIESIAAPEMDAEEHEGDALTPCFESATRERGPRLHMS